MGKFERSEHAKETCCILQVPKAVCVDVDWTVGMLGSQKQGWSQLKRGCCRIPFVMCSSSRNCSVIEHTGVPSVFCSRTARL